jgi:hypothetical protein
MHRQARERIIATEIMKLERRQAMERARRAAEPQPAAESRSRHANPPASLASR